MWFKTTLNAMILAETFHRDLNMPALLTQTHKCEINGNPCEPGRETASLFELLQVKEGSDEGLLKHILRILLILYDVLIGVGLLIALMFSVLVLLTGKGDAMSGGGSIRTTFKGKASFDDYMSRLTLILGVSFFSLMLVIDAVSNRIDTANQQGTPPPVAKSKTGK